MAEVTTSRWYTFMETPMVSDAFAPGRRIGLSATNWGDNHFVGAGIFGDEMHLNPKNDDDEDGNSRPERFGWSARGVYRPIVADDANKILHLGANYVSHAPQSDNEEEEIRYRVRPEARFVDYRPLNTDKIKNTEDVSTWGLELAGKWNRFHAQSEYLQSKLNVKDEQDPEFSGWYAQVSYFLTDDSQPYNLTDGEFGPVVPNGRLGAFELAIRYSTLDLNDMDITGGEAKNTTVGLNWYVNNNIIFRANYIHANLDENASGKKWKEFVADDDLNIYGMRVEYLF